jgi:hypothetical protein
LVTDLLGLELVLEQVVLWRESRSKKEIRVTECASGRVLGELDSPLLCSGGA